MFIIGMNRHEIHKRYNPYSRLRSRSSYCVKCCEFVIELKLSDAITVYNTSGMFTMQQFSEATHQKPYEDLLWPSWTAGLMGLQPLMNLLTCNTVTSTDYQLNISTDHISNMISTTWPHYYLLKDDIFGDHRSLKKCIQIWSNNVWVR